jgi:hypothetical protein
MACNHSLHYLHLSSYFLWNDVDAIVPEYGTCSPIYSFLSRIPFLHLRLDAKQRDARTISQHSRSAKTILGLLLIVQHLTLIAALTYMSIAMTSDRKMRCLFAVLLGCCLVPVSAETSYNCVQ